MPGLAESAAASAKWSFISVVGRRLVTLATTLILARLLSPPDFGLVAMAAVFIGFVDLVRDLGTGSSIIQTDAPSENLLSSLFWVNVGFGVIGTVLLAAVAPLVAELLREPRLTTILQALSTSILLGGVSVVPTSLLTRALEFRRLAMVEITAGLTSSLLSIVLAMRGLAVWSLVFQGLSASVMMCGGVWLVSSWRPRFLLDLSSLRAVFAFSANQAGFNTLNYFVRNADTLLVGRYLGARSVGLYDLAYRMMLFPIQMVSWSIGRALFPVFSRLRDEPARLGAAYLKVVSAIASVTFPMTFGLVGVAGLFVETVFGTSWSPVVSLLLILGPLGALQSIGTTTGSVYQALGRTDLLLRWGAFASIILVLAFAVGLRWGIVGVAASYLIVSYAIAYHMFRIPLKLIGLRVVDLLEVLKRPFACALLMLGSVFAMEPVVTRLFDGVAALGILVAVGALVYGGATWLFNRASAVELIALARRA